MSNQDTRTLLEKLDHVAELTGTYYSDTDRTYYDDAREVFAALRERLTVEPDPIAELEAMGGRLYGGVNCSLYWYGPGVMSEAIGTQGQTLSDIRAAAARLLARVRGGAK